jgi:succinate dehydrogenase flavin-adding protein (antitoxin of CptAB toxin-antitoxin module)
LSGVEMHRLRWKCRRGLLELDLVLDRFLGRGGPCGKDLDSLNSLLDLPDNDLWDIISGRSDAYDEGLKDVVARLRAA